MKWILAVTLLLVSGLGLAQYKSVSPTEEKKNIVALNKRVATTKAAFNKAPKNAKAKKAYVDANVALGLQYTYSQTVDRKVKYKLALKYLREALKYDPKNKDARQMHDQIVSIYKSMGRPVPGDGDSKS
jgi:Tfp pilus assembly protein PilF